MNIAIVNGFRIIYKSNNEIKEMVSMNEMQGNWYVFYIEKPSENINAVFLKNLCDILQPGDYSCGDYTLHAVKVGSNLQINFSPLKFSHTSIFAYCENYLLSSRIVWIQSEFSLSVIKYLLHKMRYIFAMICIIIFIMLHKSYWISREITLIEVINACK